MKHLLLNSFLIVSGALAAQPMPIDDASLLASASETTIEAVENASPARLESRLEQGRMDAEFLVVVDADVATPMLVQLLDNFGRALPMVKIEPGSNNILLDLSNYPTGSYLVSLQATQQRSAVLHKFYKQ